MARATGGDIEHVVAHDAVLAREVTAVVVGRAAEERGDRRGDVDQPSGARDEPVVAHALARDHERRPGLHDAQRTVLAAVAALVLPVVGGGVQHAQVGRRGMVEELGDVVERERVGVVARGGCGSARSASRPTRRSGDWSASGSAPVIPVRS